MHMTVRGHGLKATAAMAVLALVLFSAVAFAVWPVVTASDNGSNPAIHATSAGGPSIAHDPYIDDHAAVVARYYEGSRR